MKPVIQIPTRTVRLIVTRYSPDVALFALIILLMNGVALSILCAGELTPFFQLIASIFLALFGFLAASMARNFIVCDRFLHLKEKEALSLDILEEIRDEARKSK